LSTSQVVGNVSEYKFLQKNSVIVIRILCVVIWLYRVELERFGQLYVVKRRIKNEVAVAYLMNIL
jgi:hypothetical protein